MRHARNRCAAGAVGLIMLMWGLAAALGAEAGPATAPDTRPALGAEALRNGEYRHDLAGEGWFRLVDGVHVEKESPDADTELRITLGEPMAEGDLNGDGTADAAVVLVCSPGGTGLFHDLAAVINDKGRPRHVASAELGDRVLIREVRIREGRIAVRMVTHGPQDPMSRPTLEVTRYFRLERGAKEGGAEGQQGKLAEVELSAEQRLDERYQEIQAGVAPIRKDIANGRYNGNLPPEEAARRLEQARKELAEVKAAYDALPEGQKNNRAIGMRFLTLGKMGLASLEADIEQVRRQGK